MPKRNRKHLETDAYRQRSHSSKNTRAYSVHMQTNICIRTRNKFTGFPHKTRSKKNISFRTVFPPSVTLTFTGGSPVSCPRHEPAQRYSPLAAASPGRRDEAGGHGAGREDLEEAAGAATAPRGPFPFPSRSNTKL